MVSREDRRGREGGSLTPLLLRIQWVLLQRVVRGLVLDGSPPSLPCIVLILTWLPGDWYIPRSDLFFEQRREPRSRAVVLQTTRRARRL